MKISFRYITARKSLYLIASHLSKEASLKMDIELSLAQWNPKTKEVRKSHPKHLEINTKLNDYIDKAIQLDEKHRFKTAKALIEYVVKEGFEIVDENPIPTFSEFIKELNKTYSEDNSKKYTTIANWVDRFKPGIKLDEWDERTLDELQYFLKSSDTINSQNTIAKMLQRVSTVLTKALSYRYITYDNHPFKRGYKVSHGKPKDIKLELEELSLLWTSRNSFKNASMNQAVNAWLLSFYLDGTRAHDVITLRKDQIKSGVIHLKQAKTDKQLTVKVSNRLDALLKEFSDTKTYVLPISDRLLPASNPPKKKANSINANLNKHLKLACAELGIEKEVTMHVARHTFAYVADLNGWNITDIQHALGHSKIQQTRDYVGRLRGDRLDDKRQSLHESF